MRNRPLILSSSTKASRASTFGQFTDTPQLKSGKYIVQGFTNDGRPVFYMFTARNDMPTEARRPLVIVSSTAPPTEPASAAADPLQLFMIERAMDLMADGVSNITFIVDFNGKRSDSISSSVSLTRATLKLMNKYYPEICHCGILQGASWITRAFAGLVNKVIDFKVNYKLCGGYAAKYTNADPDNLLGEVGGNLEVSSVGAWKPSRHRHGLARLGCARRDSVCLRRAGAIRSSQNYG